MTDQIDYFDESGRMNQPPPPKQRRWWATPVIVVVSLLAGIGIGGAAATSDTDPARSSSGATYESLDEWEAALGERQDSLDGTQDTADEPEPEPVAELDTGYVTPTADDFVLTVRTLEKRCYGSAGCNVSFQIDAGWLGEFDPDTTYEVTYEIKGGDDPLINTLRVEGEQYWVDESEFIGTPSSDAELTAHVLEVRER